ncbi:PREDICTED: uncharacterized protein LOC106749713 [Dinoponera quadriceps]|uniref:Uncharacterized protein LOC106749713 n=1 Tax=Dinoponera quadriceps TaxID=609295 RepID=A0A6P3Y245_DINQU|nr:PREDICTED: uncharacterized protein LOC106749713 [Dinoponera quadriceps]
MNVTSADDVCKPYKPPPAKCDFLHVSCNWWVTNGKLFHHVITTTPLHASEKISLADIVTLDTCISLEPTESESAEPCMLDIRVKNHQKIARIAVVSEANVLEFFKQSGEYETTIFADFIDEFRNNSVYLAETAIQPPSTEASIKFTRTRNKGTTMWIYGVRLVLTDPPKDTKTDIFNYDVIQTFLSNVNGEKTRRGADMAKKMLECFNVEEITINEQCCQRSLETLTLDSLTNAFVCKNGILKTDNEKESSSHADDSKKLDVDVKMYIDNKFHDMEKRLMQRMDEMEVTTNQKLDAILRKLETIAYLK